MPESIRARRTDPRGPLVGFSGKHAWPLGEVDLDVTITDGIHERTETLDLSIIRSPSPYNIILGRPAMQRMKMVPSVIHRVIKFQSEIGIRSIHSSYEPTKQINDVKRVDDDVPPTPMKTKEEEDATKLVINPNFPEQTISIGAQLSEGCKHKLKKLLQANVDVFAWDYSDMTGVPRTLTLEGKPFVMEHRLKEHKHIEPVHQKKRNLSAERDEAARKEVDELLKAGIIRESVYPIWIANQVMVKKGDGGWRMCVDFTNINKACPKGCYPLPEIDWKVESLAEQKLKCFLDAYKGYHQIQMTEEDEDKTTFYTSKGTYCYRKMPFGLKNAGATYQRLVDKAFATQIGRNLEAYVDDMVIKSRDEEGLIEDILETFGNLRKINMKLNPKKCSFGVEEEEAGRALEQMRKYIADLPTLTAPKSKEILYVYLAASLECVSAVLMAERDKQQIPIYFVSRVLQGAEANYPELEKLTLALVHAARRLRRYFQAQPIVVLSDKPIRQILLKPEKSGRVAKWAIE
uniref:uncharacterized protein LOC122604650 n=1 Tax=Erigeron canadensis TaxID=72917 RepID=UPI001CB8E586|nr:uncharacterized protein LOC122604650 [Erigeron canadensis]